jgi:plastocyanin
MKMTSLHRALLACTLIAAPAFSAEVVVTQQNKSFSTTGINLKLGDKIVFRNADAFAHNLYSVSEGAVFGSFTQQAGETLAVPVTKEGEFEVRCAFHPQMKLQVKVHK